MGIFAFTFILVKTILTIVFIVLFYVMKGMMLLITTIVLSLVHFFRWVFTKIRVA